MRCDIAVAAALQTTLAPHSFSSLLFCETKNNKNKKQNQPLYVMVGIACGLAVYTPLRHITHAPDISLGASARDATEHYAVDGGSSSDGRRTLEKALQYRTGGILAKAARVHEYVHVIPDVGVPDPASHFEWKKGNTDLSNKPIQVELFEDKIGEDIKIINKPKTLKDFLKLCEK